MVSTCCSRCLLLPGERSANALLSRFAFLPSSLRCQNLCQSFALLSHCSACPASLSVRVLAPLPCCYAVRIYARVASETLWCPGWGFYRVDFVFFIFTEIRWTIVQTNNLKLTLTWFEFWNLKIFVSRVGENKWRVGTSISSLVQVKPLFSIWSDFYLWRILIERARIGEGWVNLCSIQHDSWLIWWYDMIQWWFVSVWTLWFLIYDSWFWLIFGDSHDSWLITMRLPIGKLFSTGVGHWSYRVTIHIIPCTTFSESIFHIPCNL